MLTACASSQANIVGRWESGFDNDIVLNFNSDGTGIEIFKGEEFKFNWSVVDNTLSFSFYPYSEGSVFERLMTLNLHGSPVEAFGFSLSEDGQVLSITDDHGHGHFLLIFTRT